MTARRNLAQALAALLALLVALLVGSPGVATAAPPNLTISEPVAGSFTNDQTPPFSGTTDESLAPITLDIYKGATAEGTPLELTVSPLGETWHTAPESALEPGQYTAVAKQTNLLSEPGASAPVTFTIDTTKPPVSMNAVPSPTNNATPTLTGNAGTDAGDSTAVSVTIYEGSSVGGGVAAASNVPVSGSGWSYPAPNLNDGTYTAQATQTDQAGNTGTSTPPVSFTIDTTKPPVSMNSVTSPTKNATPTLTGHAGVDAGDGTTVAVTIYQGGSVGGPVAASSQVPVSGSGWSYPAPHLADGTYTAQATQTDEAGNTGTSTPPVTFTIDTAIPPVSMNAVPSPTNNPTPTLTGSAGIDAGDSTTVAVTIYRGGSPKGSVAASGNAPVSGAAWSYTATHLSDGTYTAQATQSDEAGNLGTSGPVTFIVDTAPPPVAITSPSGGEVLLVSQATFSGIGGAESGDSPVTVKIFVGPNVSGALSQELHPVLSGGNWTIATRLADGKYTAMAEQSDNAGNQGTSEVTFTIKTNSPLVTLNTVGLIHRGLRYVTNGTPSFDGSAGTAPEDSESVVVNIYGGTSTSGSPLRILEVPMSGSAWAVGPVAALPDGTFTAQAEQKDSHISGQPGVSTSSTFTVDADPPQVTLTSPANGSSTLSTAQVVGGTADTTEGDSPTITIQLFAGSTTAGAPLQSVAVQAANGAWSAAFGGLSPGTYTARAEQRDDVGNIGDSAPTTFSVRAAPTPSPPVASFQWFPSAPHTGEAVSLVSSSTDAASPITGFAWDPTGVGAFSTGTLVLRTSFSTPGSHVVRLRVTDANGLSSVATETIAVTPPAPIFMQPFPVVRIVGSENASGVKISLLTVLTPVGGRVTVTCHGHRCPRSAYLLATVSKGRRNTGTVLLVVRRFERSLRAGTVLEIRVSKPGQIGKYTRFAIRRGKLPTRVDTCLSPAGIKPMACPSS